MVMPLIAGRSETGFVFIWYQVCWHWCSSRVASSVCITLWLRGRPQATATPWSAWGSQCFFLLKPSQVLVSTVCAQIKAWRVRALAAAVCRIRHTVSVRTCHVCKKQFSSHTWAIGKGVIVVGQFCRVCDWHSPGKGLFIVCTVWVQHVNVAGTTDLSTLHFCCLHACANCLNQTKT
jgi:hypothetical protein